MGDRPLCRAGTTAAVGRARAVDRKRCGGSWGMWSSSGKLQRQPVASRWLTGSIAAEAGRRGRCPESRGGGWEACSLPGKLQRQPGGCGRLAGVLRWKPGDVVVVRETTTAAGSLAGGWPECHGGSWETWLSLGKLQRQVERCGGGMGRYGVSAAGEAERIDEHNIIIINRRQCAISRQAAGGNL